MATQAVVPEVTPIASATPPVVRVAGPAVINLPHGFRMGAADANLGATAAATPAAGTTPAATTPPLGVLSNFTGQFAGTGFNLIFRPNSGPPTTTTFPNPVTPAPPTPPSENVLELNLTTETLTFSPPLGNVPNRGLESQNDIFLNGVPYVQAISDVTNFATGKADGTAQPIHFEPGLWMHIPQTTNDPVVPESLVRMASIPHGTTINAEGLAPTTTITGPPVIPEVDITPFVIGISPLQLIPFASQDAANTATPRLPQDLTKFIAARTIDQEILRDPNTVLRRAIHHQKITSTIAFTVSSSPLLPELGGGTANIAFLAGSGSAGPNAQAVEVSATFWIETVEHRIVLPPTPANVPVTISPPPGATHTPTFVVTSTTAVLAPKSVTVTFTQIQYSQTVFLNFAGLSWPHVSVATLVPSAGIPVTV
jgi:hypothetical protein